MSWSGSHLCTDGLLVKAGPPLCSSLLGPPPQLEFLSCPTWKPRLESQTSPPDSCPPAPSVLGCSGGTPIVRPTLGVQLWIPSTDPQTQCPVSSDQTSFWNPNVPSPCPFPHGADVSLGYEQLSRILEHPELEARADILPTLQLHLSSTRRSQTKRTAVLEGAGFKSPCCPSPAV